MKLICLNICVKIDNSLEVVEFLKKEDADIVALQEVMRPLSPSVHSIYRSKEHIESALGYPYSFFGPLAKVDIIYKHGKVHRDYGGPAEQGNDILSKYPIVFATNEHYYRSYEHFIDRTNFEKEDHPRALEIVDLNIDGKKLRVLNLHGIWTADKQGDERTLRQCEYVIAAAKREDIPTIIAGDFNLLPENKGIRRISEEFRNLVVEYGVESTRPEFKDAIEEGLTTVDYIFVNDKVIVKDFRVLKDTISDHHPLMLEFDLV